MQIDLIANISIAIAIFSAGLFSTDLVASRFQLSLPRKRQILYRKVIRLTGIIIFSSLAFLSFFPSILQDLFHFQSVLPPTSEPIPVVSQTNLTDLPGRVSQLEIEVNKLQTSQDLARINQVEQELKNLKALLLAQPENEFSLQSLNAWLEGLDQKTEVAFNLAIASFGIVVSVAVGAIIAVVTFILTKLFSKKK